MRLRLVDLVNFPLVKELLANILFIWVFICILSSSVLIKEDFAYCPETYTALVRRRQPAWKNRTIVDYKVRIQRKRISPTSYHRAIQ